jgi:hypothetical protein
MKRIISSVKMVAALSALALSAACGGLPSFGADLGKQEQMGQEIRVPYTSMTSYFGYVAPGSQPDEMKDGKKMYYLYLWVPVVAPEIGVRMLSPVGGVAKPEQGKDFVDPSFSANAGDSAYFDTWVRVERCLTAINPDDITKPCSQWTGFGDNDDSSELPAQPSGSMYNSVLRITSTPSDPLKALIRGMYRIGFTTYKVGEVQGTFLAQVGAPIELPGTAIAKTPADLHKLVTAPAAAPAAN